MPMKLQAALTILILSGAPAMSQTSGVETGHTHTLIIPEVEEVARTLPEGPATMMRDMLQYGQIITREQALAGGDEWLRRKKEQQAAHMQAYKDALDRRYGEGYSKSIRVLNLPR
jgi:hypothetical protein